MDLRRDDGKVVRVVLHEIPGVGRQFVLKLPEEPRRAEEAQVLVPAQAEPEQMVETDKVVHVGVRYKDVIDLQELAGRKVMQIPEIEKEGLAAVFVFHVNAGISEGIVNKGGAIHRYTIFGINAHLTCHEPFFSIRSRQTIPPVWNLRHDRLPLIFFIDVD